MSSPTPLRASDSAITSPVPCVSSPSSVYSNSTVKATSPSQWPISALSTGNYDANHGARSPAKRPSTSTTPSSTQSQMSEYSRNLALQMEKLVNISFSKGLSSASSDPAASPKSPGFSPSRRSTSGSASSFASGTTSTTANSTPTPRPSPVVSKSGTSTGVGSRQTATSTIITGTTQNSAPASSPPIACCEPSVAPAPAYSYMTSQLPKSDTTSDSTQNILTTSTESTDTIQASNPPSVAQTPSYPFPRMLHREHSSSTLPGLSARIPAQFTRAHTVPSGNFTTEEQVIPNMPTPMASVPFAPTFASPRSDRLALTDFPSPNIYNLSLMLTAEPGLDAWWESVVQIMVENFKAERVSLSVPADPTDIDNVPWGQKATFSDRDKDSLSMGYLGQKTCGLNPSINIDNVDSSGSKLAFDDNAHSSNIHKKSASRPSPSTRKSYASHTHEYDLENPSLSRNPSARRSAAALRRHSHYPPTEKPCEENVEGVSLRREALEQYDTSASTSSTSHWDLPKTHLPPSRGRVLPVLQALDYEADPLIDNNGVRRVLDRGDIVALTRTYPYLKEDTKVGSPGGGKNHCTINSNPGNTFEPPKRPRFNHNESTSHLSEILGGSSIRLNRSRSIREQTGNSRIVTVPEEDDIRRPSSPSFEEHEQAPFPIPGSPTLTLDPEKLHAENPFFADSVNKDMPSTSGSSGSNAPKPNLQDVAPPENSWTVLHIPLSVAIIHKSPGSFHLDPRFLDERSHRRARSSAGGASRHPRFGGRATSKTKPPPIAILSILTPVLPYPNQLVEGLEHLSPHLAHSFSLCRQYSMITTELAGLRSRRTGAMGFGGLGFDGRPLPPLSTLHNLDGSVNPEMNSHQSVAGSITSPSEWSAVSRSAAGSPVPTPSFEDVLGPKDKRPLKTSPALLGGDGYFAGVSIAGTLADMQSDVSAGPSTSMGPLENAPPLSSPMPSTINLVSRSSIFSEEYSVAQQRRSSLSRVWPPTPEAAALSASKPHIPHTLSTCDLPPPPEGSDIISPLSANRNIPSQPILHASRPALARAESNKNTPTNPSRDRRHSLLHSYGADFATSFPTLPQAGTVNIKAYPTSAPTGSNTNGGTGGSVRAVHMPPPSDKLKSLILDSLPAQVFVAMPLTGEIMWVNSRYLSYRGLSVQDLAADPYGSIHPDDRQEYLKAWGHSLRTGDQFSRTVRIKRFDDCYRWFYARAVASRDKRGLIIQLLGSYMDIHDQHIAELKAARQEEIEASEAKHRLLANLIPQIVFTATSDDGITFVNDQWLSYTSQSFDDSLRMNFLSRVHPEDLAKFHVDVDTSQPSPQPRLDLSRFEPDMYQGLENRHISNALHKNQRKPDTIVTQPDPSESGSSRTHSTSSNYAFKDSPMADIETLIHRGIVKVTTDNTGRIAYSAEMRLRSKGGEYRWHLVRCVEIENINSVKTGVYFGSATDINDQKLLEEKLKEAMESKSRFLSNMSHEIRTPLIGISGMITFLHDTQLTEEQQDYANTIQNSANSLLLIINDILDLSKAAAGMMRLSYEWFHTRSLIEDVNELVSTMAIHKSLELNYVVDESVPSWVKGDKVRIRQVLLNVIGNAIKFTTVGEVFSRCRVYVDDKADAKGDQNTTVKANNIMLEFIVIDTGRGFTKKEAELMFKPFSQIDGSSTRQHGGSGLGLVISRQLVELHGGRMIGTATPGKGSQFSFTARFALPSAEDHPDVNSTHTASSPGPCLTPPLPPMKGATEKSNKVRSRHGSTASSVLKDGARSNQSSTPSEGMEHNSLATIHQDLVNAAQATRASGADFLPSDQKDNPGPQTSATPPPPIAINRVSVSPPQTYSILIVCPQDHSREATSQHIEMTLPKDLPHTIRALPSADAVLEMVATQNPGPFTHVVLNVGAAVNVVSTMNQIDTLNCISKSTIIALCDTVQRQALMRLPLEEQPRLIRTGKISFINKPLRPSRLATIFDPDCQRDFSIDRNRSSAEQQWETQRAHYSEVGKIIGNRGHRVLLVEDNPINRKVLTKFLQKMGVDAEVAVDGQECTEKIMTRPQGHYHMVLCDLHMPRKDGYQACRDVRAWEQDQGASPMPFIALSANVMPEVQERCSQAGFTDYITKPVDFINLSRTMAKFL
ncbi:hypothetical protein BROUX41_003064 [Berkeleyomyces rouxiae]|uniref:uncharacterized protein n=1 Tax=Berkeleyomyces rouxiae TaxID=2035830 RepID=UPI003B7F4962